MATSVADLSINVSANIAQAVESMDRLRGSVGRASDQLESLANVGRTFALGFVGAIAGAFSIRAITDFVAAGINAQAKMQDLADSVGTTASALSSLLPAARLSGTSMEEVAAASAKFSKSLVEVQSGTGAASRAFAAFGLTAKDAARFLQDPVQGMFELSKRSQQFANDGNLAAARMALMGKSASQLAPFMKQLAEQSALTATMTDRQAQAAKALEDQWETLKLAQEQYRNDIAAGLVPALGQLLTALEDVARSSGGLGTTLRELGADGTLGIWLLNVAKGFAIVGESVFAVIKTFSAFAGSVNVVIEDIKLMGAQLAYVATGLKDDSGIREALARRELAVKEANERWSSLWNYNATAVSDSIDKQIRSLELGRVAFQQWAENSDRFDRMARGQQGIIADPNKPASVKFSGGDKAKKEVDEFSRALEAMQKILRTSQEALDNLGKSAAERMSPALTKLIELAGSPKWNEFSVAMKNWIIDLAAAADANWHLTEAYQEQQKAAEELAKIRERTSAIQQREIEALDQLTEGLAEQLESLRREGEEIGKTEDQLKALTLARINDTIRAKEQVLAAYQNVEGTEAVVDALKAQINLLNQIRDQTASNQGASALAEQAKQAREGWLRTFEDISNAGAGFLEDLFNNGSKAFANLWENFKRWAIAAFAKIAAQQIVVSIVGSLGGGMGASGIGGALSQLGGGGGGGGILDVLGMGGQGGGGLGGMASGLLNSFALSGAGTALGLSSAVAPSAAIMGAATAAEGLALGAGVAGTALTSFGAAALAAVPVVGWIAAAGLALYSIFSDDEPSETKGRIGIKPPGSPGFEDDQSSKSNLGQVGFVDVDTMYFSGEVAKVLTDMLAGALDAFASRMDSEGADRLSKILQETTFQAFEGELSTEDFLNKFGGQALQEVVQVAFQELEPALAAVVSGFSGTAQEVANFSNALLGIYDVTRDLPDAVRANILGALDATQETADKVLAFAAVLTGFGDAIDGLGPQLEALDPASIIAFVDALGGAQAVVQSFTFLAQNFLTDADRFAIASEGFSASFEAIGLTVEDLANAGLTSLPKTHEEFMRLLRSFDLMTVEGLEAYAAVMRLSQGFIAIHGTAEQAAQAMRQLVESAEDFFGANFYTEAEQAATRVANAIALIDAEANRLGVDIPRSISGFRDMIEAMRAAGQEGTDLYRSLIVLGPAIYELNTAMNDVAGSVSNAAESLGALQSQAQAFMEMVRQEAAQLTQSRLGAIDALVSGIGGDLGDQLALKIKLINEQIQQAIADISSGDPGRQTKGFEALKELQVPISYGSTQPSGLSPLILALTRDLARFTVLEAQFDAKRAEQLLNLEKWYAGQQELFRQSASAGGDYTEALTALEAEFKRKWDEIIKGVSEGVEGTIDELEKLRATLAKWLQSLNVSELSPLKPLDRLAAAKTQFEEQLKLALGGDKTALAGITQFADQYLRIARDLYKSSSAYTDIFDFVTKMIAELAGTATTGLPYPTELPPRVPPIAPLPPSPPVVQLPPIAPLPAPSSPLPTPPPLLGPPQTLPTNPLPAPPPMPAPVLDSAWTPPPNMELLTGFTDKWDVGASIASVLPANGARLASSEDMMALAKRVDAVVDAIAALADANSEDSRHEVDELTTVRRAISSTFETLK